MQDNVLKTDNKQIDRWILPKPIKQEEHQSSKLNGILQKVLARRGLSLNSELDEFLFPSDLPDPEDHFSELNRATQRIIDACDRNEKIAICGDYDADGITSTVLLVELLTSLGSTTIPYIPSRQDDGYGLNIKIINDIKSQGINLVITVDNGISAFDAIKRCNELDIDLIITDHHKIPKNNLNIFSLIHPERTPHNSPYKYLAGVGIAYMLAKNICNKLNFNLDKTTANVLFCIGTVADMAPLLGANRKWLKDCLPKIYKTNNNAIKLIIKKLSIDTYHITTEDIGFKLAPLINAVGRIGNPYLIIDLLTNTSECSINKLTNECFSIHKERKRLTAIVEEEAMELATTEYICNRKFLVIMKEDWNLGIIGIAAARVLDKYNLPTAILAKGNDGIYRGSIRSNNFLKVNLALDECKDILIAYGGHAAAAGFTVYEENIPKLKDILDTIAIREMKKCNYIISIKPEAHISFDLINNDFYTQLASIGPFGMNNPSPLFWTRKCKIKSIIKLKANHIKLIVDDGTDIMDAIRWNNNINLQINNLIDIAFHIERNKWSKTKKLQLNIVDIKRYNEEINLKLHKRNYKCKLLIDNKLSIKNEAGKTITSESLLFSKNSNKKENIFNKKLLSFAEIALGKVS